MGDNKLLKHIAEISAGLMLAVGAGAVVSSQNTISVQASTDYKKLEGKHIKMFDGREMMPLDEYLEKTSNWHTVANPYNLNGKNNIKFHWYKKAHVRNAWENTDQLLSQAVNVDDRHVPDGKIIVLGTATVNGVHYYITGDSEEQEMVYRGYRNLTPSTYFEQPKLGVLTKSIRTIDPTYLESEIDKPGVLGVTLDTTFMEGAMNVMHKGDTIMIPSHHDAVELFGTKYVPVLYNNDGGQTGATLMKETNFDNYVKSGEGHKMEYNGNINYQKNGKIYSKVNKVFNIYKAAKIESRKLKSSKRKKSYEKRIIYDLKDEKKSIVSYGL